MRQKKEANSWVKFRLLTWKNFLQQWRHPWQTVAELLLPVVTLSLILLLRWQIEPRNVDLRSFEPVPVHSLTVSSLSILVGMNLTRMTVAYSPESEVLEDVVRRATTNFFRSNVVDLIKIILKIILEKILENMPIPPDITLPTDTTDLNSISINNFLKSLIKIEAYNSSADLRGIYSNEVYTRRVLAAVEFNDTLHGATEIPNNINYSLRFPERPRLNSFYLSGGRSWRTDLIFPLFEVPGPRSSSSVGGSDPGYVHEMFVQLQHFISMELISRITGENFRRFNVNFQRFPHPAFVQDFAIEVMQALFPIFIVISFSYTAINITRVVTLEKELQLKESLKIMGMPTWIHWCAWFLKQFIFLLLATGLIVIVLKVPWFTTDEGIGDYALFTQTPWDVLFFFLALYLFCTIFFCFMISGFFSVGSTAALFMGVVWFLSYIPSVLLMADINLSTAGQIISFFSINTVMSYGFHQLLAKETLGGMQWGEFMSVTDLNSTRLPFGYVVIFLLIDSLIYMLIALYLEQVLPGPYGIPKPWNFIFRKDFWCSQDTDVKTIGPPEMGEITMEKDPPELTIGVEIRNLTKIFGANTAVNNLSLNIYDDQITVLLGHNGAGKSTTISMLTGNLPATRGSVSIAGYDMKKQMKLARSNLGLCPQHNVIFNELTVREHLEFFARLKGFKGKELNKEIDTLIDDLELQSKRNYLAEGLSGGQKRRLCVGIALSGQARVVLLDEPTSGMDPSSRRALWDLLQKVKKGRSIILTTHFMDEADILGDRVAIMAHGQLQCVGSPYFLKKHYGVGYTLVVVKNEEFNHNACTLLINKYIPNTEIKEDRGTELTYSLSNENSDKFETMLNDLETNRDDIKFKNYGLVATTLEDVFLSVGSDAELASISDETDTIASANNINAQDLDTSSTDQLVYEEVLTTGIQLLRQHVTAVWMKLWLTKIRSWTLILLQFLVPLVQIVTSLAVLEYIMSLQGDLQSRPLRFTEGYASTESLLSFNGTNSTSRGALAKTAYEQMYTSSDIDNMDLTIVDGQLVDDYYLQRANVTGGTASIRHSLLSGATFGDESATAWFSNFGYHDLPSSLATLHNALLKAFQPDAEINVNNHPLEVNYRDQSDMLAMVEFVSFQLSFSIGNSLGIVTAVYIMFYIKERMSRAKLLQKAAGIRPVVMWSSAAVFDWIWFLQISLTVVLPCAAFRVIGLSSFAELGRMYVCIMVYGAAALPLHYLFSFLFTGPAVGFVVMYFINLLFGIIGSQIVEALYNPMLDTAHAADIMDTILQFFPLYSFVTALRSLSAVSITEHTCLMACDYLEAVINVQECNMQYLCENRTSACCIRENPYFEWESPGVLRYLVVILSSGAVFWILLMIVEYRLFQKVFTFTKKAPPIDVNTLDNDVVDEARHVEQVKGSDLGRHSLVASGLTKYYGKHLAVNQVSFTVSESECFGLLGVNGAGKTTTFKMLMGDETISSGDAYIGGDSVKKNITRVYKNIGYCPQFEAVFEELTGRETLYLFSLLRGLDRESTNVNIRILAHALGFTKHLDKRVHQYSGGNKRKLSTAVALMGRTRLVFVDEPTTGVDPAAKRQVWQALRGAMSSGRGVVLTSHSMEECEALCSRLTIMVGGGFRCIGTPQHLKNKFSQGFTLTIKLRMDEAATDVSKRTSVDNLKQYVCSNFTSPKLMEEYQGLLTYYLPDSTMAWSRMFGIMENAKRELDVEDYSISQTTLEQIFLQFTKYQDAENSEDTNSPIHNGQPHVTHM
ncbi:phospholipid-transporting ATPase ABCA1-like [Achroia grisella]|uniref:phospholipid-transporting ATPase ABCA1-like n=1 Tax=Achroia grisella TaxID=688607 RepID=UPI0027D234A0|nr:phospholipid-transporting ATPase ABCA1-like [Achroia grisella]